MEKLLSVTKDQKMFCLLNLYRMHCMIELTVIVLLVFSLIMIFKFCCRKFKFTFKGQMEITPACYAHLLSPLLTLAEGRVAVILEGGYCLESLAEGAALTLKTLLGDPCPMLIESLKEPCDR